MSNRHIQKEEFKFAKEDNGSLIVCSYPEKQGIAQKREIQIDLQYEHCPQFIRINVFRNDKQTEHGLVYWDGELLGEVNAYLAEEYAGKTDFTVQKGMDFSAGQHLLAIEIKDIPQPVRWFKVNSLHIPADNEESLLIKTAKMPDSVEYYNITSHDDFAWRHPRAWHEERYIQVIKTVLKIMREHPHYIFQLENKLQQLDPFLKWAQKHEPHLIDELKLRLNEGRMEVICGLSVPRISEIYPETLIRNMVMGREYFKSLAPEYEQEVYNEVDVMPGSSQMPQICKLAGYSYYMFTRPMGRQVVFNWIGLDGSTIISSRSGYSIGHDMAGITHACAALYRPPVERVMIGADDVIPDKNLAQESNKWDLSKRKISTITEYFKAVEKHKDKLSNAGPILDSLSVYSLTGLQGMHNLYFRNNRTEDLLLWCESLQLMVSDANNDYEEDKIKGLWYEMLENIAHAMCHIFAEDFQERSDHITKTQKLAREYIDKTLNNIAEHIQYDDRIGQPIIVVNRLGWKRSELATVNKPEGNYQIKAQNGAVIKYEQDDKAIRFIATDIPSVGYRTYYLCPADTAAVTEKRNDKSSIENKFYRINADENGALLIYDKITGRYLGNSAKGGTGSVVFRSASPPDPKNGWVMLGPFGNAQNCKWDKHSIRSYNGAVSCRLETTGTIGRTEICRTVCLHTNSRRIDFKIEINSHDKRDGVYRFVMPFDIKGKLTAGIDFGAEVRKNYEKELFREEFFEKGYKNGYYATRWTDYSSDDYGYTFVCPHGAFTGYEFDPETRIFEFTLLRARSTNSTAGGTGPDSMYGLGKHKFDCALIPHKASWQQAFTYRDALEFHNPLITHTASKSCKQSRSLPLQKSLVSINPENIVLSAARMISAKEWELRFYETTGKPATAIIETAKVPSEVRITNFLGESVPDAGDLKIEHNRIHISIGAWEIITLRVSF